jgi:hypothetical protein
MARQFVSCVFREGGRRYTYHWDGALLAIGDRVIAPGIAGPSALTVTTICDGPPAFETKALFKIEQAADVDEANAFLAQQRQPNKEI